MAKHNFKELKIWQRSIDLAAKVYSLTAKFPDSEKFGLISQTRRSAVSVPSNIAEGSGRGSNKDFSRFLDISLSSSFELETQLIIAKMLNFKGTNDESFNLTIAELSEVQNMIFGFQNKIK